tara:strand:- start:138 stop:401 length:264 start_codon:yes stop_codon:yes gene_type:complete
MNKWRTTSYIGVTSNIAERINQHRTSKVDSFTKKYKLNTLVYYEIHSNAYEAICREKELKGWTRKRKVDLIKKINPELQDLSHEIQV